MKPGPHVIELRDADGNLKRKAVGPVGCLEAIEKAGQVWLGRALWFAAGVMAGIVWRG